MNQEQLAELLETTKQTVSRYENGERRADQDILFQLSSIFGVSIDDFFPEIKKPKTDSIYPHYSVGVSAGVPIEVDGITETETETIIIPDAMMGKWAGDRDIFIMHVNGESMNKVMPHGSMIAVKPVESSYLRDGDIVVYSDGTDYAVKRFYKQEDKLVFKPDSTVTDFYDQDYPIDSTEVVIHGKVVLYIVELE